MTDRYNPQTSHWTENEELRAQFLQEIKSKITAVSPRVAGRRRLDRSYREDITSEINLKCLQQMQEKTGAFAEPSVEDALRVFLDEENSWIQDKGDSFAQKEVRYRKRNGDIDSKEATKQADVLAAVRFRDLPSDRVVELREFAECLVRFESQVADLTAGDRKILGMEAFRKEGIDDLSSPELDEVVKIAGISGSDQLAFNKYHDKNRKNSDKDRTALSRAMVKVNKAFPEKAAEKREAKEKRAERRKQGKLKSALGIVAILSSLALWVSFDSPELADHQKDRFNQKQLVYVFALFKGHQ